MICTSIGSEEDFDLDTFAQEGVDFTDKRLVLRGRARLLLAT